MSENLQKLVGVVVMAVLVVVGVVVSSGDDTDFTRNTAFGVPKLGGGLDDEIQQPGDAENDLALAMAAAAKCGEGYVLVSTGDPVSPWRCGPLLAEMPTMQDVREASLLPEQGSYGPCNHVFMLAEEGSAPINRWMNTMALLYCMNDWANGRTVEAVENALRDWVGRVEGANEGGVPFCVEVFGEVTIERAPGNGGSEVVVGLGRIEYRCDAE
ncbi:MAG TPA: hypothetical protein EYQ34_01760 [Acidimicrobiia bacterium]|nr:hypothetical protein [Acidimicrobiia bacterium]